MKRSFSIALLTLLSVATLAQADEGNPKIKKIESIAFAPKGVLLIAGNSQVVAVETGDVKETTWTKTEIPAIDQLLAAKLGSTAKDIQILKVAVNPASHKAYISVRSLKANQDVILTVDGAGNVAEFSLENVKYNRYPLAVGDKAVTLITDICWSGNRIFAATQASDVFASRVFSIDPNLKGAFASIGTETYHVGHGKWETKAPIRCIMPYEENGKANVVGSFTCTPIVKYSVDDVSSKPAVKGVSVVELGTGNTPRSMFGYENGGKKYVLINVARNNKKPAFDFPSGYWVARVDAELLKETTAVNEKAPWRVGGKVSAGDRVSVAKDYFGVHQMDKLDATRAVVIREEKDGFALRVLPLP